MSGPNGTGGGRFRRVEKRQGNYQKNSNDRSDWEKVKAGMVSKEKEDTQLRIAEDELDTTFGFERFTGPGFKTGFCYNMRTTTLNADDGSSTSGIDFYFVDYDGSTFKASYLFDPYFLVYIKCPEEVYSSTFQEMESYLMRRFEGVIKEVVKIEKEDLDMLNHLAKPLKPFMQIRFNTIEGLVQVRKALQPIVDKNIEEQEALDAYADSMGVEEQAEVGRSNYGKNVNGV